VFIKTDYEILKDAVIGSFDGTSIIVLNTEEHVEITKSKSTWQFYSLELLLSPDVKRQLRQEQGRQYVQGVKYTAYLDCSEAAKAGVCLVSYCNSPKDAYTFYGADVEVNAYLSVSPGSTTPTLHAPKKLRSGMEVLWNYRGLRLPRTIEEELYSKVSGHMFPNEWMYPFSRNEIIKMLTDFNSAHPKYNDAMQFLNTALDNIDDRTIHYRYRSIELLNVAISKHNVYPDRDSINDVSTLVNEISIIYIC